MTNKIILSFFLLLITGKAYSQQYMNVEPPVYPGCETKENKMKCMRDNIINLMSTNFHPEALSESKNRPVVVECIFTIRKDGYIEINEIKTSNTNLKKEILRVLSKIPPVKPAIKENLPINIQYKIPFVFE